jgi:hypothetical protein
MWPNLTQIWLECGLNVARMWLWRLWIERSIAAAQAGGHNASYDELPIDCWRSAMTMTSLGAQNAVNAADVAQTPKWSGSHDAVQALALLSIAQTLAEIAENLEEREDLTHGF